MNITHDDQEVYKTNKTMIEMVEEFQKAFGQPVGTTPKLLEGKRYVFRTELAEEELDEYMDASLDNDLIEVLDALVDQAYILFGTVVEHGMQDVFLDAFREVHRSNMSKLDENKKPIVNGQNGVLDESRAIGKVLKSKFFSKPNLKQFL